MGKATVTPIGGGLGYRIEFGKVSASSGDFAINFTQEFSQVPTVIVTATRASSNARYVVATIDSVYTGSASGTAVAVDSGKPATVASTIYWIAIGT